MKNYKYIGKFIADDGNTYTLDVVCASPFQAFFLLTADAIRSARHYQLHSIECEDGDVALVGDIMKVSNLITF